MPRRRGFAMVMVLATVAVLAVLAGVLAFVVEREATGRPELDALVQARAAVVDEIERARFRTQRLAGADRRITATLGRQGLVVDGRRGVAGVWSVEETVPRLVGWLCGAEVPNDGEVDAAPEGLRESVVEEGPDDVVLVGLGSVAQRRDRVVARLRIERIRPDFPGEPPTPERMRLRVANVVLDEGVKASLVSAADAMLQPSGEGEVAVAAGSAIPKDARWQRASVAVNSGLDSLFPGLDSASAELHDRAERIFARSQARLLGPAVTAARLRSAFHDVTLASRGVLTSTNEAEFSERSDGAGGEEVEDPAVAARLRLSAPMGGSLEVQPLHRIERGALAGGWTSIAPVLVEASFWLALTASESNVEGTVLELKHETRLALWNASAVELTVAAGELEVVWEGAPGLRVQVGDADDPLYEGPCPEGLRRMRNRRPIRWLPGETRLLRGDDFMADDPGRIRWISNAVATDRDSRAEAVMRLADVSPVSPLIVLLRTRGSALGSLRAQHGFMAAEVTARSPPGDDGERWDVAYGVSAAGPAQQDPRAPRLRGTESASGSRWSPDPVANVDRARVFAKETLPGWVTCVAWDVPVTPSPSWLMLRSLLDDNGKTLGAPGALALNRVFDDMAYRVMLDPGGAESAKGAGGSGSFLEKRAPLAARSPGQEPSVSAYWIRGAFNVNSTSLAAWAALLRGALDAQGLPGLEGFRVPRRTLGLVARDQDVRDRARGLARSIVRRSQLRDHPFRSVSEFVSSGIVEAAIAESGLNEGLPAERKGTPGWIDQADLLCRLAPRLVARSDTFLVRAYADVLDVTTGRILARVWAEATLQRGPEWCDRSPTGAVNTGSVSRRFEIVDFRWLLPDEV
jgi:hypothetical protein